MQAGDKHRPPLTIPLLLREAEVSPLLKLAVVFPSLACAGEGFFRNSMDNVTFKACFNTVKLSAWMEEKPQPDGSIQYVGMSRRVEYDYETGAVVSDQTEPTGINAVLPADKPWWK